MDEKTPHLHLTFVPLTKDNRLCAKEIIGNRANLTKWQDDFHASMVEKYPDLERGESASKTGRKHCTRLPCRPLSGPYGKSAALNPPGHKRLARFLPPVSASIYKAPGLDGIEPRRFVQLTRLKRPLGGMAIAKARNACYAESAGR